MHDRRKHESHEPFGELMKPFQQLFQETPIKGFLQQMDELFQRSFSFTPSFHVKVSETEQDYVIKAELPGVNKEQIDLDVWNHYVTISVQSSQSLTEEDQNRKTMRKQQSIQRSSRTIPLPQPIDEGKVKASYKDGLLQIKVAKGKKNPVRRPGVKQAEP